MSDENKRPKFAMSMASAYINKEIQKSLFGKPFIPMVAYLHICAFVLQQCGLLGRIFAGKEIPFITVFAADEGKEEIALEGFEAMMPTEVLPHMEYAKTFLDVVHLSLNSTCKCNF
jgi:hypothetical protein